MDIVIKDNRAWRRYEAELPEGRAQVMYARRDGAIMFTHTEVPAALEGRGVGSALARHALDEARAAGLKVIPRCPFMRSYIQRHPEYQDLVIEE